MNAAAPTGPQPDDSPVGALNRISGEVADITRRMTTVSDDLTALRVRLSTLPATQSPAQAPATQYPAPSGYMAPTAIPTPPRVQPAATPWQPMPALPQPTPVPRAQTYPQHYPQNYSQPQPGAPRPVGPYRSSFQPPQPKPMSERIAAATERGLIGKILAGVGVAITLIGVVLLLVLAAQAGLLRPEFRVAGGAVLAAVLVGIGVWIGRDQGKRAGAGALVATGVATALFDVLAATAIYDWLPSYAGLIIAAIIAAGGLAVAHLWDSQALGLMVGIGLVVLAPFLAGGDAGLLVGFLLIYAAATLWIQIGRRWTAMFATNTVVATLPLFYFALDAGDSERALFVVAASANLILALGSAMVLMRSAKTPLIQAAISAIAVLPMLATAHVAGDVVGASVLAGATVALVTLALAGGQLGALTTHVRVVWLTAASVTAVAAVGTVLGGSGLVVGVAGVAVVMSSAALITTEMRLPLQIIATVFTGLALLYSFGRDALRQLLFDPLETTDQVLLLVIVTLTLAAVAMLTYSWAKTATGSNLQVIATTGSLIGLWLVTNLCVGLGALIGGGSDAGLRAGHAAATIVWVLAGAAGLLWARRQERGARALTLTVSLSVIAAAVAKLFLFDLAALDGVFRVIAFIVVGLLLLSLWVAYAQSLTSPEKSARRAGEPAVAGR